MIPKTITPPLNDGILNIYNVDNIAEPGNKPKQGLKVKVSNLRYEERTVGMTRYWTALQANARVQQVLRVPRINTVHTDDVAVPTDGTQYKIIQVQYPPGIDPKMMDLSLEKVEVVYDIANN